MTEGIVAKRTKLISKLFGFGGLLLVVAYLAVGFSGLTNTSEFFYNLFVPPLIPLGIIYLLFSLWIAALIAKMAWKKGRSWNAFFTLALFVPVIAWIIAAVISTDQATAISGTKKCPKCAEFIKAEASLCKHCGSEV